MSADLADIGRWLAEYLPAPLLRSGPARIYWWQWLALPLLLSGALAVGYPLAWLSAAGLHRLAQRMRATWDDELSLRLRAPLKFGWSLAALYVVEPWLALPPAAAAFCERGLRVALFAAFFWGLWRIVIGAGQLVGTSGWAHLHPASRALIPLAARVSKVLVVIVAVIAVLAELGYPVASLIAGLGIGGLAVALAAQKTVENLFGAFSIGVDQPFREGDFVHIDDFVGTVEAIGLRSTRIRTLDRTVISLPNGKLADMKVETFATRDRIRLGMDVGLKYGTTGAQVREVIAKLEAVLRVQPKILADGLLVRLKALGEASLVIEVNAYCATADWNEFTDIRQEVLLEFMEAVEAAGASLALPMHTVHLVDGRGADRG